MERTKKIILPMTTIMQKNENIAESETGNRKKHGTCIFSGYNTRRYMDCSDDEDDDDEEEDDDDDEDTVFSNNTFSVLFCSVDLIRRWLYKKSLHYLLQTPHSPAMTTTPKYLKTAQGRSIGKKKRMLS